jgi:3-phosphoinositide dependent protein kinase-1
VILSPKVIVCYVGFGLFLISVLCIIDILLDRQGHIKLGDFGTATIVTDNESPRTSFVGTQDYVSPEVLSGERKATKACDLWAVGCMIYQIFTGVSPFRGATEYLTFELIMGHCRQTKPLEFPSSITKDAADLIEKLLKTNEWERLGAGEEEESENSYLALKNHSFFNELDWASLCDSVPPYQPDPSNFPSDENMRDGATDDWLLEGEATPIAPMHVKAGGGKQEEEAPTPSQFSQFLSPGELQVFTSIIFKRKVGSLSVSLACHTSLGSFQGLFSKRRQLILTDKPRLFYLDPDAMELKGEIPWTKTHPVSCVLVSL